MRLRRTSAVAAVAALAGLVTLGSVPSASANTPNNPNFTPPPLCKTGDTGDKLTAKLSGFNGVTLTVGGASKTGSVTFSNTSGHTLPFSVTKLGLGLDKKDDNGNNAITVQIKGPGRDWATAPYDSGQPGNITLARDKDLKPGATMTLQLRLSAPKGTKPGGYGIEGAVASIDTANSKCVRYYGADIALFKVAAPSSTPAGAPTPKAPSTSPTTAPSATPSASATTNAPLATTGGGSNTGLIAGAAGALILVGGAGVFVATRRRKAAQHD